MRISSVAYLLLCPIFLCGADFFHVRKVRQSEHCEHIRNRFCTPHSCSDYKVICGDIDTASLSYNTRFIKCINCKITSFDHSQTITSLEVENSFLPDVKLGLFNTLSYIEYLSLTSNNISTVEYHAFGGLRKLISLNLSSNSIRKIRLDDLGIYSNIQQLDLSFNLIKGVTFPKTLGEIYMSENQLIIENDTFSGLYNLTFLDISHNKLSTLLPHVFQDLRNLLILNVSCNHLVSLDYGSFSGLHRLNILNISVNFIDNIPEYVWHDIDNLRELYVNNNNLTDLNTKLLRENLPMLDIISLHDNSWECNRLSNLIRILRQKTHIISGNCMKLPNIINICCTKDGVQQTFVDSSEDRSDILQTLKNFFNEDFRKSNFFNFFAKDYKEQNFWKYFDGDFRRSDMFRFFDTGFSQSQFYRYFNRDYLNATFQNKIIEKIDSISSGDSRVNMSELKDNLKGMFGELFLILNATNSIENLPETQQLMQHDSAYKDILLCVMATVIALIVLYVVFRKCNPRTIKFDKLKLYDMFRSKASTVNDVDIEIV